MRKIIFRLLFIAALIVACLYLVTPIFSITELIYPVKIDSVYLRAQQLKYERDLSMGRAKSGKIFLYNPTQLGLLNKEINVKTKDSVELKGWYVTDSTIKSTVVLILLPDINESKLNYINVASEFVYRELPVCLMDMRAQGESEGACYTMGKISVNDVSAIIDTVIAKFNTPTIVLMGSGTAATIALQASLTDARIKILLLQNPFENLNDYLHEFAEKKYGVFQTLFFKRMKQDLEQKSGIQTDSLNLSELIKKTELPTLFISSITASNLDFNSAKELFLHSNAKKKKWIVYKQSGDELISTAASKEHYDAITAFINSNIPPAKMQSKFKKLVYK